MADLRTAEQEARDWLVAIAEFGETAANRRHARTLLGFLAAVPSLAREGEVAVVLHEDRHCDSSVFLFDDPEVAVRFAKARIREFDRFGQLTEDSISGWLYNGVIEDCGSVRVEVLPFSPAPPPPEEGR